MDPGSPSSILINPDTSAPSTFSEGVELLFVNVTSEDLRSSFAGFPNQFSCFIHTPLMDVVQARSPQEAGRFIVLGTDGQLNEGLSRAIIVATDAVLNVLEKELV